MTTRWGGRAAAVAMVMILVPLGTAQAEAANMTFNGAYQNDRNMLVNIPVTLPAAQQGAARAAVSVIANTTNMVTSESTTVLGDVTIHFGNYSTSP